MGLDIVELIVTIEDHFGIRYHDNEMSGIGTIGELTDLTCLILEISNNDQTEFSQLFEKFQTYFGSDINRESKIAHYLPFHKFQDLTDFLKLDVPKYPREYYFPLPNFNFIKWKDLTAEEFINGILIKNAEKIFNVNHPKTIYQVYLVIGKITEDRIGSSFYDIQPRARFSNDLGID